MIQRIMSSTVAIMALFTMLFSAMFMAYTPPVMAVCANDAPPQCQVCEGAGGTYSSGACAKGANDPELIVGDASIFNRVVNILSFVVGAVSVIMLVVGGLRYVLSAGDANAVTSAKNTILYAIVGLVIVFAARSIILFVVDQI